MATRNLGEEILTLDNELITADESGGEDAVPNQPGVLLLHDELPPDPPIRKIDVKPRLRTDFGSRADATAAVDGDTRDPGEERPRLAWPTPVSQRGVLLDAATGDEEPGELVKSLSDARRFASLYHLVEARTRAALYDALGCLYDLSLVADMHPQEYLDLLEREGIEPAERAPRVALAKLVFGKDYDKTRLSEYASVISYCHHRNIEPGKAAQYINDTEGGIRQIVAMERLLRGGVVDERATPEREAPRKTIAKRLAQFPPRGLDLLEGAGDEYVLVIARRNPEGVACLLGEVPRDIGLLEKAARSFLAQGRD